MAFLFAPPRNKKWSTNIFLEHPKTRTRFPPPQHHLQNSPSSSPLITIMPPTFSLFPNHHHRRRRHHHNHGTHLPPVLLSAFCLLVGAGGIAFALFAVLRPKAVPTFRCGRVEDTFRSSNNRLLGGDGISDRPKLLGFVGIQTGFSSRDRRDALRSTWFPSDADGLVRYIFFLLPVIIAKAIIYIVE